MRRIVRAGIAPIALVVAIAGIAILARAAETATASVGSVHYLPLVYGINFTPTPTATSTSSPTPTGTRTPIATETPSVAATATISATSGPTFTPTPTADSRFGITVTGGVDAPTAVSAVGVTWWYSYDSASPGSPGAIGTQVAQIGLGSIGATPIAVATIQAAAKAYPGGYWIIGNEPNVAGPASVSTDFYAEQLQYYASAIKGADPTAQIVGPNVLNWSFTCDGCSGYTSGASFAAGIRASWAKLYGGEPPIDVWSLHSYPITWNQLPMTNATIVEQQVSGMAGYLAGIPADANKPIWLSEFGVLWGYDGITSVSSGCASAPNCAAPVGAFDDAAVTGFLTTLLPWLETNSAQYHLQHWFLYTTVGAPFAYSTVYSGISLLNANGSLTSYGQLYHNYTFGSPN